MRRMERPRPLRDWSDHYCYHQDDRKTWKGPRMSVDPSGGARGEKSTADLFTPVSVGRISEVIVEQMRVLIREGKLVPGDRLPSERSLCERFGVSRVTIREALRVLEASGLVEIRVG